jgi:hypothetical protein
MTGECIPPTNQPSGQTTLNGQTQSKPAYAGLLPLVQIGSKLYAAEGTHHYYPVAPTSLTKTLSNRFAVELDNDR